MKISFLAPCYANKDKTKYVDSACVIQYPGNRTVGKWYRTMESRPTLCDDETCMVRCKEDGSSFHSDAGPEYGDGDVVTCYDDFRGIVIG